MNRTLTAEKLAARLFQAEIAMDAALREVSGLLASLPQSRADAGLAATAGQSTFRHLGSSIEALIVAREGLCSAHHDLGRLAKVLDIDLVAIGPIDKPDDDPPVGNGGVTSVRPSLGGKRAVHLS
ncbi:MAG: hypothetical protein HZY74_12095 [Brevundimonas sp.]|nr:MAG: hypothetical protein HZY74_12095 [Brevundimonas sp.]